MPGSQELPSMGSADLYILPLQLQAMEIIDEILSSAVPGEAGVRESLRRHVADYPGQPEKALLLHMLTVGQLDQDDEDRSHKASHHPKEYRKPMDCDITQQLDAHSLSARFNHAGCTVWELWLRYYSLGGEATEQAVAAQLRGELALPDLQQQVLGMALSELCADATAAARIHPSPWSLL
jgi:hypothetical protein